MLIKREAGFLRHMNCETAYSPAVKHDAQPPPPPLKEKWQRNSLI